MCADPENSFNDHRLDPPVPVFKKKSSAWSQEEAKNFIQWVLKTQESRSSSLLDFFRLVRPENHNEWECFLSELGMRYARHLRESPFSELNNGRRTLTERGMALALDTNLLVAELLTRFPDSSAYWELLYDPGAFSHNHPVLRGFAHDLYLDPFGGIYEARALLAGKKSPDLLTQVFTFWRNRMLTRSGDAAYVPGGS